MSTMRRVEANRAQAVPCASALLSFALYILVLQSVGAQSPRRQTSAKVVPEVPPQIAVTAGPTMTALDSLKGIRALSVLVDGFGTQNQEILNKLVAHLEQDGITVLPNEQYPQLYLAAVGASSDFSIGYVMHSVYGSYVVLAVFQAFPLNGGRVEASTYRKYRLAAGLNTPLEKMRNSVIDDFFTDWEKVNPLLSQLPSRLPQDGDLVTQNVYTIDKNSEELKSSVFWDHDLQVQYDIGNQNIFGDAAYRILWCTYQTKPRPISANFWFKKAPPRSAELQKVYNPSIFTRFGIKPVDSCPANVVLAIKAKEIVQGEPPQSSRDQFVTHYP